MRNKIAKALHREAKAETVGMSVSKTRGLYLRKKREYKDLHKSITQPKLKLSKRGERRFEFNHGYWL